MSSPAAREHWRNKRTQMIEHFCAINRFKLESLNNGYQLRIEDSFDFYPTNGRWHFLPTGERGDWHTEADLKRTILTLLDRPRIIYNPKLFSGGLDFSPVTIPEKDTYRLSHPTTTIKPSLWQKIKRLFR